MAVCIHPWQKGCMDGHHSFYYKGRNKAGIHNISILAPPHRRVDWGNAVSTTAMKSRRLLVMKAERRIPGQPLGISSQPLEG